MIVVTWSLSHYHCRLQNRHDSSDFVVEPLLGVQRYFTKRYDTYRDTCATIRYVSRYFSHRRILFGNNQIEISVSYFVKGINSSFNDVLCSRDED